MASFPITVTISHGVGSLTDDLDQLLDDHDLERYVIHSPGACAPCRANDNPNLVPHYAGCVGNVAGHHMESVHAQAVGNLCKCTVGVRRKGDRGLD